ncbi:MAG: class II fructose-bisphosphate aldolase [Patescibacteria group bacterium]
MNLNTKDIFKKAVDGGYAIPQLNISSADQMKAVVEAAKKLHSPLMFGTSEGERKFLGLSQAVALANIYEKETGLPVILNADHTKSMEKVVEAVEAGYNSIHIDASELSYEENIKLTRDVVSYVKSINQNISVEGELGHIGGTGASKVFTDEVKIDTKFLTDPEEARIFVEKTGIDRLGVAIGNFHGLSTVGEEKLDMERLSQIQKEVGEKCLLVLHGASGIHDEDIKESVRLGIRKINVNTELRVAFSDALKLSLESGETTPYKFLAKAQEAMQKVVEEKMIICNSNNKA